MELLAKINIGFALAVTCLGIGVYIKGVVGIAIIALGYIAGFIWVGNKAVDSHEFVNAVIDNG